MTGPANKSERPARLVEGGASPAVERLLRKLPEPKEPEWARERIRARLSARPHRRVSGLEVAMALVLLVGVATGLLLRSREPVPAEPLATVMLAAGDVALAAEGGTWREALAGAPLPPHGRLRTGTGGRALAHFADATALFGAETVSTLGSAPEGQGLAIHLLSGNVAVSARPRPADRPLLVLAEAFTVRVVGTVFSVDVAADRAVEVRVREGTVVVAGPQGEVRVGAGQSWSSRAGAGTLPVPARDAALLRAFSAGPARTVPLFVEGPEGAEVSLEGVPLGAAPLRVLAPPGVGTLESGQVRQQVQLAEGREARVRLASSPAAETHSVAPPAPAPSVPAPAPAHRQPPARAVTPPAPRGAPAVTPVPQGAPVPEASSAPPTAPSTPSREDAVATLRARLAAAGGPEERETIAYALARELVRRGAYAEAVALFAQVGEGRGPRAEVSLYEVGRLRARFLQQPGEAAAAFEAYLRRFPQGTLEPEVLLSLAELEIRVGALERAEPLLDTFLARHLAHERTEEVHLLRGHVRREGGHCAAALEDYAVSRPGTGERAAQALYFSAVCAQRAGQSGPAREYLQDYLRRFPQGAHRAAVERALGGHSTP